MNIEKKINPLLLNLQPFRLVKQDALMAELHQQGLETFDFTVGDPREPTPDFIIQTLKAHVLSTSQYPSTVGLMELRTATSHWLKRRFDISVDPKTQIISTNGSKEAVFHIPQVLIDVHSNRKTIVFPEPGYPVYKSGTVLAGGEPYEIPLKASHDYIFDLDDIPKEMISKISALWVCYPHNPTGAQITTQDALKIYTWALENDIVLLSDECYVDMYFEDKFSPPSFLQIAQKENYKNLLCFFSLSKRSGMTGYRSGFVAGDATLLEFYSKYRLNVGLGTPDFVQHAAIAAWSDDDHARQRNVVFCEKRKMVENFLIKNNFEFLKSTATFYMWVTIPKNYKTANEFCDVLARKAGIFATPGEVFGPHCKQYFRLALVPTVEKIQNCLERWQNSINEGVFS